MEENKKDSNGKKKSKKSKTVLKDEVVKFFGESTIPGFKYVVKGQTLLERTTWAIFIAIAFGYAGNTVYQTFLDWDNNPVITTIDEVGLPVSQLPFPAITVCDIASLKMPRRNRWNLIEKLLNSLELINPEKELTRFYPGLYSLFYYLYNSYV